MDVNMRLHSNSGIISRCVLPICCPASLNAPNTSIQKEDQNPILDVRCTVRTPTIYGSIATPARRICLAPALDQVPQETYKRHGYAEGRVTRTYDDLVRTIHAKRGSWSFSEIAWRINGLMSILENVVRSECTDEIPATKSTCVTTPCNTSPCATYLRSLIAIRGS